MEELKKIFIQEATELIELIEESILELEDNPNDSGLINNLFRNFHTIKGSAGTTGFDELSSLTHKLEDLLSDVRDEKLKINDEIISLLFEGLDYVKQMVFQPDDIDSTFIKDFETKVLSYIDSSHKISEQNSDKNEKTDNSSKILLITLKLNPEIFATGQDPLMLFLELDELGVILNTKSKLDFNEDFHVFDPFRNYSSWKIIFQTDLPVDEIKDVFIFVEDDNDIKIENITQDYLSFFQNSDWSRNIFESTEDFLSDKIDTEHASLDKLLKEKYNISENEVKKLSLKKSNIKLNKNNFLRINTEKMNKLMDNVGEIMIAASLLSGSISNFNKNNFKEKKRESLEKLSSLTNMIFLMQEDVMSLRMVPIESTFKRFKRMVRDLSKKSGKEVSMDFFGIETEIDKTINDKIVDPLKHLIRNSLDHGIEKPEERRKKGKNPVGKLKLSAYHLEGKIIIEVTDDGKGIDKEKIKEKALEKNLIDPEKKYSDNEILSLIFHPGFSTADKISEISGRGVGMDVVKQNIDDLNGLIDIHSEKDKGTSIKLKLPLTLSIIEGIAVHVDNRKFILPIMSIVEMIEPLSKNIKTVGKKEKVILSRGKYIPLINLASLLSGKSKQNISQSVVLVIEGEKNNFALIVEEVIGKKDAVIKSLNHKLLELKFIAGASIMDDGSIALILDAYSLEKIISEGDLDEYINC